MNNRRQDREKNSLPSFDSCPFLWTAYRFLPIEQNRVTPADTVYPLVKTRFWCYSIHVSVNDDPVQLLFCGDLTILLLGLIIYCLFLVKEKTAPQPSQAIAQRFSSIQVCRDDKRLSMIFN